MPVPYAYVPYMHDRVLTPRQAWQVAEQVIADGRAADCQIFLDYCERPAPTGPPPILLIHWWQEQRNLHH